MTRAYYLAPIPPMHSLSGAAFNTFTTFQDISPKPDLKIPANFMEVGTQLRVEAQGQFSNTATPTLSIGFYWGTAAVVLAQSSAITTTTGATAWPWEIKWEGRVRVIGSSGSIQGAGTIALGTSLTAMTTQFIPTTAAARVVTIDTSIEKVIGVGAAWGASSASNTITTDFFSVLVA